MINKKYLSTLVALGLISVMILTTDSVSACYYKVGTFENDYTTTKNSFYKGEAVYCKGSSYGYDCYLKLRIMDPDGNIVYESNKSKSVVYGSFFLNETVTAGVWTLQLGTYYSCKWQWSDSSDRISYFFVTDANFTLTVNIIGNGDVTVDPELNYYSFNSLVNLKANPDFGWEFAGWSGDLTGSINPENITMDSDKTINATFNMIPPIYYGLSINIIGNGTVTPAFGGLYLADVVVELEAIADLGWKFEGWSGDLTGISNQANITMDEDKSITATFSEIIYYSLTINMFGNGTVTPASGNIYPEGSIVEITAIPDPCWEFDSWSGDLTGNTNPTNFTMDGDKTVNATFTEINQVYYTLIINVIGNGYVTPASGGLYLTGTEVQLKATANSGWVFDHWSGNLSGKINPVKIIITEDKNVTAYFIKSNNGDGDGNGITPTKTNKHPIANLSAGEPYFGFINEEIEFNASLSHDPDGKIVKYEWIFGDGTTGVGEITTHLYSIPGEYEVELKVTDNRAGTDSDETVAVIVEPNHSPSEPVIIGPTEGKVNINYSFSMFSTDDDLDEIKYTVDWGDGNITKSGFMQSGVLFNTSHMWLKPGQYIIRVKADDGKANTTGDLKITIHELDKPSEDSNNFILILLGLLALILLILLLLIAKRKKDEDEEEEKPKSKKKKK